MNCSKYSISEFIKILRNYTTTTIVLSPIHTHRLNKDWWYLAISFLFSLVLTLFLTNYDVKIKFDGQMLVLIEIIPTRMMCVNIDWREKERG